MAAPSFRAPSRRGLIIILVVAVLLGAFGVWALYASNWLRVERVSITGTKVLTPHEVVAAADAPMNAPLASVDTDALDRRLRARLPRIKAVDVERSWPNTIGLKVTERVPELLLRSGGKFVEVDAEGVRFATVRTAPRGVPLLEMAVSDSPSLHRFGIDRLRRLPRSRSPRTCPPSYARTYGRSAFGPTTPSPSNWPATARSRGAAANRAPRRQRC